MASYTFIGQLGVSSEGVKMTHNFLSTCGGVELINVEGDKDKEWRKYDIDLLYGIYRNPPVSGLRGLYYQLIEVKTDWKFYTGNYFLEIISNTATGSLGCFLKSGADFFFYCFPDYEQLHIIELKPAQEWLRSNWNRFYTSTETRTDSVTGSYHTEGKLVDRALMQKELPSFISVYKNISPIVK